jgi:hypothetical protein
MPDVSRLLKINMAAVKPEVHCISGTLSTESICYFNRQQIKSVELLQTILFKFTNYSVNFDFCTAYFVLVTSKVRTVRKLDQQYD